MELGTSGFSSGELQGGVLLGARFRGRWLLGVRAEFRDVTVYVNDQERSSAAGYTFGLAARLPVLSAADGALDLALGFDAGFMKTQVHVRDALPSSSGGSPALETVEGTGFVAGFGPQLRYWIHPNLALGYLVELSWGYAEGSVPSGSKTVVTKQVSAVLSGLFTLTAAFGGDGAGGGNQRVARR